MTLIVRWPPSEHTFKCKNSQGVTCGFFYQRASTCALHAFTWNNVQGGSNMTGTICVYTSHSLSRSYLNHLVHAFTVVTASVLQIAVVGKWAQRVHTFVSDLPLNFLNVRFSSSSPIFDCITIHNIQNRKLRLRIRKNPGSNLTPETSYPRCDFFLFFPLVRSGHVSKWYV